MGIEEDNIKYFRDKVDWYDNHPRHKKAQEALSKAFEELNSWIGVKWITPEERASGSREVRLLDYACGTGVVTWRLVPYITHALGVDITPEMVNAYNDKVSAAGIPTANISAISGNILKDHIEPSELTTAKYFDFDIVVVALGYHHFADPAGAAKLLAERLKPGGVLLLIDLEKEGESWNPESLNAISRHGFDEADMRQIYDDAGLIDFGYRTVDEKMTMEGKAGKIITKTIFFSRGVKPVT